jgi:hypothetical protein
MDLILATANGQEECVLPYDMDLDLGGTNDFQLTASYASWDERIEIGKKIYIPDTEYGGIIKNISSATNTGNIFLKGYTWRGYLAKRIISPPSGQDYYIASGELNSIIRNLVSIPGFVVSTRDTGVSTSYYRFNRYTTVLEGIEAMLRSVGYRLDIRYIQSDSSGYVFIEAVKAGQYGDTVDYSQDSMIDFSSTDNQMGVNHLICLGKGELKNREVVHLYTDKYGNISQTQTIFGVDEIVEVYDNSGAEAETLLETGRERLKEKKSSKSFDASIKQVEMELFIGDTVTGQDYITGNKVTTPITQKLVKRSNGVISYEYKIGGQK